MTSHYSERTDHPTMSDILREWIKKATPRPLRERNKDIDEAVDKSALLSKDEQNEGIKLPKMPILPGKKKV